MFARALPIFREISDKNSYAITLINIAGIMKDEGDLNGANKTYDQALIAYGAQVSLMQMASCASGDGHSRRFSGVYPFNHHLKTRRLCLRAMLALAEGLWPPFQKLPQTFWRPDPQGGRSFLPFRANQHAQASGTQR